MEFVPEQVKAARIASGLSQREVSEIADVSIDTVRRAENGTHEPGASALGRLAAALGVGPGAFYADIHDAASTTPGNGHGVVNDQARTLSGKR